MILTLITRLLLDDENNSTIQSLTPKLIPVFEKVLGPPEEQLEKDTRQLLVHAVQILYKAKPDLFRGHEELVALVGGA